MLSPGPRRVRVSPVTYVAAVVTVLAWAPFLTQPLTADEAGFLMLGREWGHGTSLYGNYWVDRPPVLLWLYRLGAHLMPVTTPAGGLTAPGVRLLGVMAAGAAVVLAGVLAAAVASRLQIERPGWTIVGAPVLAGALLTTPLFGMPETNGEVLAVPFVLLGLWAAVRALEAPTGRRTLAWAAGAGAAGMTAMLIKQSLADALVFGLVLALLSPQRRRLLAGLAGGAISVLAGALASAAALGTTPAGLWDAVVVFRIHASAVISTSASSSTPQRMSHVAQAFVTSGAALVLVATVVPVLRRVLRPTPERALPAAAMALVAWELVGVAAGGSYWMHYLTGLVPGLVLLVALARPAGRARHLLAACLAVTALSTTIAWTQLALSAPTVSADAQVETYLRAHAAPGDGVVVAFGHPNIVAGSGLQSPYPQLWSLPVRVRDPHLTAFTQVLSGPDAPRWVVVAGNGVASWGLDATRAQQYLDQHYTDQVRYGGLHVWEHR
ncbi:hypothetical protein GCM10022237_42640 [Nocardioides ginsengisoli]|uniref:Glycosyltransferase RgtA/B/C/D-like domain-containing protein n=1 Tax=Nocardioides ginsengisoli TaxID=363868 RepID=A0ABW3VVQ7_9ACTN